MPFKPLSDNKHQFLSYLTIEPIPHLLRLQKSFRQHDNNLNAAVGDASGNLKFFEIIPDFFSTFDEDRANLLVKSGSILISTYF